MAKISQVESPHSEAVQKETRDQYGKFTKQTAPLPSLPNTPNSPNPSPPPTPPNFLILLWNKLTKLSFKKLLTLGATVSLILTNGIFQNIVEYFFPYSSPILHRQTAHQGVFRTSGSGSYSLTLPDSSVYTLYLKPSSNLNNLKNLNEVVVKGNLTLTPYVIENAEIYPLNISTPDSSNPPSSSNSLTPPTTLTLPKLYPSLTWETEEEKVLVFTSGKRRLDMQGIHLESSQVKDFPQGFIDYYTKQLTNLGFKQTLNSKDPDGLMQTFAKEDKYFTFGIKNIFQGSGDNKQLVGYKAYIEHN